MEAPSGGKNDVGEFFLKHFCKVMIDPVSDFVQVNSYPDDEHKLELIKMIFPRDTTFDRKTVWFSKVLLSYLGNFDFTKTHFDNIPSCRTFHGEILDKIVWQYPHPEFISTSKSYAPTRTSVPVRSNLVERGELAVCAVPDNSESINSDASIVQWTDSLDNVRFRIVYPGGELVSEW